MTATLACAAGGTSCRIEGDLDFHTVPALWQQIDQRLAEGDLVLDLGGVGAVNSAGLVLLLEAREVAMRRGVGLAIESIPPAIYDIAAMYNARQLLPDNPAH